MSLAAAHPPPSLPWSIAGARSRRLDAAMTHAIHELAGPLAPALTRVVAAGGKRLRPAVTLAVAELLGAPAVGAAAAAHPPDAALRLAASVELLHCATLVHDDLIDEAATRRGVGTVSAVEGGPAAVVGGDLLIAAATLTAARAVPRAGVAIATTLAALCRGEALQESLRWNPSSSVDTLLEVAALKTGSLLEAAGHLGADAVDAPAEQRAAVGEFGRSFGISLQLVDDLLDLVSSPALSGKPVGADFTSGILTVPARLALDETPGLVDAFRPHHDPLVRQRAVGALRRSDGAIAETVALAEEHARRAGAALEALRGGATSGDACAGLAAWPSAYLSSQLDALVSDEHRWLLGRSLGASS